MKETVIEIIAEQLEVDKNEITGETNFMEDLEAESLDIFQVLQLKQMKMFKRLIN